MGKKKKKFRKPVNGGASGSDNGIAPINEKARDFQPFRDPFRWWAILFLFIVGLTAYFSSFRNGFIWDDAMLITPNEYIRNWGHLKQIFTTDIHHFGLDKSNFYRPFQAVSYMLDYTFWELNPMGYHISSALIHFLNAVMIYLILVNVIHHLDLDITSRARDIALASACIWLVHPIHTQVVTYAAGRADQLVALFVFFTLYTFMTSPRAWLSPLFFVGALLSKEFAVITPLFILLFDWCGLTVRQGGRFRKILPFLILLAVYIVLRLTIFSFPTDFSTKSIPGLGHRLLTSAQAISILIGLLVAPFDLSMDRNIPWQTTLANVSVILSISSILLAAAVSFLAKKKYPIISFGLLWFFIGYLLVANIIPMNANVSEHWMYVPSVGLIFIVFYLLYRLIPRINRQMMIVIIMVLTAYYGILLVRRNADFKNEITFYNQILKRNYKNARVHYNLGCAYFYEGDMDNSRKHLLEAIRFKPDYAAAYGNLGQLEYRKGNVDRAIELYEKANGIKGDLVENRANLGVAYVNKKRFKDGIEQLNIALELNPKHVAALNNMGIAYGSKGDYPNAERYFKFALSIDPADPSAKKNLDHLYALMKQKSP